MSSVGLKSLANQETSPPLRNSNRFILLIVLFCSWFIAAFIFSLPNREGPTSAQGLDFVAQLKLISRAGSLVLLAVANLLLIRRKTFEEILPLYSGFIIFFFWSAASVSWSCLPEVSAGQVFSYGVVLLLSVAVAQSVQTSADVRLILFSLNGLLLVRSTGMLILHFATGQTAISREGDSFIHSTEAAETAAPAIVLLVGCVACLRDRWINVLLIPAIPIYLALFLVAQNRLSLVATPLVVGLTLLTTGNRSMIVKLIFAGCFLLPAYMLVDPGLEFLSKTVGSTEEYALRSDDSGQTFSTLSGRTEMWAAVWEEYVKSPIRGHGYFVTSSTGELDVWNAVRNYTAHNQLFQVLATTGIIGLGIFLFAIWFPLSRVVSGLRSTGERKRLAMVCAFLILYIMMWSTLNSSFSGALGSCSITCYIVLGLIIGGLRRNGVPSEEPIPR